MAVRTSADEAQDPAAALHARTRRRLIGAAALLLAAVIVLPMVLDPTPQPVPDSVAIDIPSDRTPFTPRLSAPAADIAVPVAQAPVNQEQTAARGEKKAAEEPARQEKTAAQAAAPTDSAAGGRAPFALQAAALASPAAARELMAKLKNAGFAPYTEKINTGKGERIRVRIGPFATREEAEQARAQLRTLGIDAGIVNR